MSNTPLASMRASSARAAGGGWQTRAEKFKCATAQRACRGHCHTSSCPPPLTRHINGALNTHQLLVGGGGGRGQGGAHGEHEAGHALHRCRWGAVGAVGGHGVMGARRNGKTPGGTRAVWAQKGATVRVTGPQRGPNGSPPKPSVEGDGKNAKRARPRASRAHNAKNIAWRHLGRGWQARGAPRARGTRRSARQRPTNRKIAKSRQRGGGTGARARRATRANGMSVTHAAAKAGSEETGGRNGPCGFDWGFRRRFSVGWGGGLSFLSSWCASVLPRPRPQRPLRRPFSSSSRCGCMLLHPVVRRKGPRAGRGRPSCAPSTPRATAWLGRLPQLLHWGATYTCT